MRSLPLDSSFARKTANSKSLMRRIRKSQADQFKKRAAESFEQRGVLHLRRDVGWATDTYTDNELRQRIQACRPRAKLYGLHAEAQLISFVDVTFLLGEHFDTDPQYSWSQDILSSSKLAPQDRANLLLATAFSVFRQTRQPREQRDV